MKIILTAFFALALTACTTGHERADTDFAPLLNNADSVISAQWQGRDWDPAGWPLSFQNPDLFMAGLRKAEIVKRLYMKGGKAPVLVAGPNFYRLSDLDQGRVAKAVDTITGATKGPLGGFLVEDWATGRIVAEFTKNGLALR